MNRRSRARVALLSVVPLLAVAAGLLPWGALSSVLIALAVLAALTYFRTGRRAP
ncbi:hypothetical protein [Streptomyces sp. NBC_01465]|uniref:hypothetical protein n=1 Tax=Streptomyces sp. NBC_01465 TaxID=2903878 RepID=UPI002E37C19F|nr:hypothetical protein [Streptomyces sp. NBC_01465]